jgi:septal ring factor EnvC (AmiA/AmiB activator)
VTAVNGANGANGANGFAGTDNFLSRLERSFDLQEKEFQKTRDDVNALKTAQSVIQRDLGTLTSAIQSFSTKLDEQSRTNWPAIALAVTMFIAVVPGMGFLMANYTSTAMAPLANASTLHTETIRRMGDQLSSLDAASASSQMADANSRTDRAQLNERLRLLEAQLNSEIAERRATGATVKAALAEIEGQFHAVSNLENLRAAQQERLNSMLYEAANPGKRYPNGTFFPTSLFGPGPPADDTK